MLNNEIFRQITPVFANPILDTREAYIASKVSQDTLHRMGVSYVTNPALREAGALAWSTLKKYSNLTPDISESFKTRQRELVLAEKSARNSVLPVPTIGIEVEIPLIGNNTQQAYSDIFYELGFKKNRANLSVSPYFEVATSPSASANVQADILYNLIKLELLPSLTFGTKPQDIYKYLSPHLISLHVNLGTPRGLGIDYYDHNHPEKLEPWMLATALALVYSSPLRLANRKTDLYFLLSKTSAPTIRNPQEGTRMELRALEVRDKNVYELIYSAQMLGLLYFVRANQEHPELQVIARKFATNLGEVLKQYHIDNNTLCDRVSSATLAQMEALTGSIRKLIKNARWQTAAYQKAYDKAT